MADLTDAGTYNLLNESGDGRRYQWSWWVPVGVVAFISVLVLALVLLS